jgi:hypothetical protein
VVSEGCVVESDAASVSSGARPLLGLPDDSESLDCAGSGDLPSFLVAHPDKKDTDKMNINMRTVLMTLRLIDFVLISVFIIPQFPAFVMPILQDGIHHSNQNKWGEHKHH